jgi:LmbE family N-acetylglucosaminyl deacetylase
MAQALRAYQPQIIPPTTALIRAAWSRYLLAIGDAWDAGGRAEGLDRPAQLEASQAVLFEATVPLTELEGFNPNVYVNITDVWETKLRALKAFGRAQAFLAEWYADTAKRRAFQ